MDNLFVGTFALHVIVSLYYYVICISCLVFSNTLYNPDMVLYWLAT